MYRPSVLNSGQNHDEAEFDLIPGSGTLNADQEHANWEQVKQVLECKIEEAIDDHKKCGKIAVHVSWYEHKHHVKELKAAGLDYKFKAPLIPSSLAFKSFQVNQHRMTVDVMQVNERTEHLLWPMPILKVVNEYFHGSKCFYRCIFSPDTGNSLSQPNRKNMIYFDGWWNTHIHKCWWAAAIVLRISVQHLFEQSLYRGLLV